MASKVFATRARKFQSAALAVFAACALTLGTVEASYAGSGEPAHLMFRKNKGSGGTVTQNVSHTAGSGGKAATETQIVTDGSISPFLLSDSAAALQTLADKYAAIVASGGWPKVPGGKLKKGSTGKSVEALNRRLHIEGYLRVEATQGEFAQTYTTATEDAVRRFQRNHGLYVNGSIDGPTLAQLNVPADRRLATLRANIPRVAEYSKDLGSRYVVVNVPAQQIETVNDGRVYSIHNAIVGRPSRPTPVVMTPLATVRFNPYWNAPPSIVEKDILPRMISSSPSKVMASMNMKVFDGVGGPEIDPNSVNWRRVVVDNYHFRQEPGGDNAMATAKIEFNSPFGIYLHDTPEPHLFGTFQRFYSSGCVRVEKVATLINWILQGQDGIDSARIAGLAESKERLDTKIANPPQLRVAYLTAWPTRDGVAAFRSDIYELDGTGFVLGQPLPVGETSGGQRYVLKPIPRSQAAVDEAEAFGFGNFFRRNDFGDRERPFPRNTRTAGRSDSLVGSDSKQASAEKKKAPVKTASLSKGRKMVGSRNDDGDSAFKNWVSNKPDEPQKKPVKKAAGKDSKSKKLASKDGAAKKTVADATTSKKKVSKKEQSAAAARTPEQDAKKVAASTKAKPAAAGEKPAASPSAKKAKPEVAKTADKCKAGADGKLPEGCKAPVPAKKPVAKPEKTAAAAN